MNKKVFALCFLALSVRFLLAQGTALPLGNEAYPILDRLSILHGTDSRFHPSLRYFQRGAATRFAMQLDTFAGAELSRMDRRDLTYIFNDNNEWLGAPTFATRIGSRKEKTGDLTQIEASLADSHYVLSRRPILKYFYRSPANLIEVNDKHLHLRLNPMIHFFVAGARDDEQPVFNNLRGAELRGGIDDRIYFYANIVESQSRFPDYVNERILRDRAVPGAGYFKDYKSEIFNISNGYDYLNAQGYLGFHITRHVGAQFGYGRNFIGNGYRSLLLSDFANNYLYFKFNWQVWKIHYQNIFAELAVQSDRLTPEGQVIPKKYMAAHHFSIDIRPNFNVGVFEAVVFNRNNGFELNYLNPVILYRTAEQGLNSPDNVLIGFDGHWDLFRRLRLYGQLILDEFVFKELFIERRGWWANKFGIQAGLQYVNVLGIDHLDLRAELNIVRPYTYTYRDSSASYTHYQQALAHPLGANFSEWLLALRYQPLPRLLVEGRVISALSGEDADGSNWGGNLLLPHTQRERDYGNTIGQGIRTHIFIAALDVSYQLAHNLYADLQFFSRHRSSGALVKNTQYIGAGLRMNVGRQKWDF